RLASTSVPLCAVCFVPAETQSPAAGVGIQAAPGSTSGATRVLCSWPVVPVPVSCHLPPGSPIEMDLGSACRLTGSWDPREKGAFLSWHLLGTAGCTLHSPCIWCHRPPNFPCTWTIDKIQIFRVAIRISPSLEEPLWDTSPLVMSLILHRTAAPGFQAVCACSLLSFMINRTTMVSFYPFFAH
ncbi:hypothetical protein C8R43DRAFT_1172248, partial [Mycena crocata]